MNAEPGAGKKARECGIGRKIAFHPARPRAAHHFAGYKHSHAALKRIAVQRSGKVAARDGFILENGNALIAWTEEVKEITPEKKVVFEYKRSADAKEIGTCQRLASGTRRG